MLTVILKMEGGYEVVGEAAGGMSALKVCRETRPELVILDLELPELSGTHVIRLLPAEDWSARVLVYTSSTDESLLRQALAEGPHGFVRKEDPLPELRSALRAVASGSRYISPWSASLLPAHTEEPFKCLTPQECAVLQMIAEGRQKSDIAQVLGTREKEVDHHRRHVMQKLRLRDEGSLTQYAIRHRMVNA